MNLKRLAMAAGVLFAAVIVLPVKSAQAQQYGGGYGQNGYGQYNGAWDAPPSDYDDIARRGFHDGIEGARKDYGNHRQPDVENRDEYRHPDLPRDEWEDYREGFRRGYQRGIAYLTGNYNGPMNGPGPNYGDQNRDQDRYQNRDWNAYSGPVFEARRHGYEEGMEGAIKDFGNHRRPDPDNRDEYRHPAVPGELQDPYRDGFQRGYQQAMSQLMNGGEDRDDAYREQGPRGQARMHGFQEGMEGAMHDFDNHRRPDPDNRDEFRHPDVPHELQDPYRDGFRRGYSTAMNGLMGLPAGRRDDDDDRR